MAKPKDGLFTECKNESKDFNKNNVQRLQTRQKKREAL